MKQVSIAFQTDKSLSAYGRLAQTAEAYGFHTLTVYNDMLYQPAWLPLLEMARHTSRVQIGPMAVNPFTCHPINIAGNMALLDEASNGRAYLGMARGAWLDFVGVNPKRPISALRDAIRCVRHLWQQNKAAFPSEHFPLAGGDSLRWHIGRSDIPIVLGSWGEETIRACLGEITAVKLGGTANPDMAKWLREFIGGHTEIVVGAVTVVDEDGQAARQLARREVALYLPVVATLDKTIHIEPDLLRQLEAATTIFDFDRAANLISDELLRRFAFAGTPTDITHQTLELFDAGVTRVEFGTPHGLTATSGLQLLGEKVLPALEIDFGA
jgi:5,10-methylenetetrahydromethanopterin reductase